jgi:hypothetical protein
MRFFDTETQMLHLYVGRLEKTAHLRKLAITDVKLP